MTQPVCLRLADPQIVQQLWRAIIFYRQQKQVPNNERIIKFMTREFQLSEKECLKQLEYSVSDGLIYSYSAVSVKGSLVGHEQDGYKVPDLYAEPEKGEHDWYCFNCHLAGEVIPCSQCFRVYHPGCLEPEDTKENEFICEFCQNSDSEGLIKKKHLNRLLTYTVHRLKDKTKELHRFYHGENESLKAFIYLYMDLNTMEAKSKTRRYKHLNQFLADAQLILHNTHVCFGENSRITDLSKIMMQDCRYDLDEIIQCKDCYYFSNAKPPEWFTQPCRPPHDLVYAKQKGYSYWPAKVIKITNEGYDVRFFGSYHQRAVIPETSIRQIDSDLKKLNVKKTPGFSKSMQELKLHQKLVAQQASENSDEEEEDDEEELTPSYKPVKRKRSSGVNDSVKKQKISNESNKQKKRVRTYRKALSDGYTEIKEDTSSSLDNISSSTSMLDDNNMVSSTEDQLNSFKSNLSSQKALKATVTTQTANNTCESCSNYSKMIDANNLQREKDEEKLKKDFEEDKQQAVARAMKEVEKMRDRCKAEYLDQIKKINAKHKSEIDSTKRKQWCSSCFNEAMYHCCWNTSYCSLKCQQEHWQLEHKKMCRRKR